MHTIAQHLDHRGGESPEPDNESISNKLTGPLRLHRPGSDRFTDENMRSYSANSTASTMSNLTPTIRSMEDDFFPDDQTTASDTDDPTDTLDTSFMDKNLVRVVSRAAPEQALSQRPKMDHTAEMIDMAMKYESTSDASVASGNLFIAMRNLCSNRNDVEDIMRFLCDDVDLIRHGSLATRKKQSRPFTAIDDCIRWNILSLAVESDERECEMIASWIINEFPHLSLEPYDYEQDATSSSGGTQQSRNAIFRCTNPGHRLSLKSTPYHIAITKGKHSMVDDMLRTSQYLYSFLDLENNATVTCKMVTTALRSMKESISAANSGSKRKTTPAHMCTVLLNKILAENPISSRRGQGSSLLHAVDCTKNQRLTLRTILKYSDSGTPSDDPGLKDSIEFGLDVAVAEYLGTGMQLDDGQFADYLRIAKANLENPLKGWTVTLSTRSSSDSAVCRSNIFKSLVRCANNEKKFDQVLAEEIVTKGMWDVWSVKSDNVPAPSVAKSLLHVAVMHGQERFVRHFVDVYHKYLGNAVEIPARSKSGDHYPLWYNNHKWDEEKGQFEPLPQLKETEKNTPRGRIRDIIVTKMIHVFEMERLTAILHDSNESFYDLSFDLSRFDGAAFPISEFINSIIHHDKQQRMLKYEHTLKYVEFPSLDRSPGHRETIRESTHLPHNHSEVFLILDWLEAKGVTKIIRLTIPDRLINPHNELDMARYVRRFQVEELDWRVLDLELSIFQPRRLDVPEMAVAKDTMSPRLTNGNFPPDQGARRPHETVDNNGRRSSVRQLPEPKRPEEERQSPVVADSKITLQIPEIEHALTPISRRGTGLQPLSRRSTGLQTSEDRSPFGDQSPGRNKSIAELQPCEASDDGMSACHIKELYLYSSGKRSAVYHWFNETDGVLSLGDQLESLHVYVIKETCTDRDSKSLLAEIRHLKEKKLEARPLLRNFQPMERAWYPSPSPADLSKIAERLSPNLAIWLRQLTEFDRRWSAAFVNAEGKRRQRPTRVAILDNGVLSIPPMVPESGNGLPATDRTQQPRGHEEDNETSRLRATLNQHIPRSMRPTQDNNGRPLFSGHEKDQIFDSAGSETASAEPRPSNNGTPSGSTKQGLWSRIVEGRSFVDSSSKFCPWQFPSDPHGTQMANLICAIDPLCEIYVARVSEDAVGINPDNVAKAIDWAIQCDVDIISMSFVLGVNNSKVHEKVELANNRGIIMTCSSHDEGTRTSSAYPASYKLEKDYDHVLVLAACDQYGKLLREDAELKLSYKLIGDRVRAGIVPFVKSEEYISGSSVATAIAAGLCSLILTCDRMAHPDKEYQKSSLSLDLKYRGTRLARKEGDYRLNVVNKHLSKMRSINDGGYVSLDKFGSVAQTNNGVEGAQIGTVDYVLEYAFDMDRRVLDSVYH